MNEIYVLLTPGWDGEKIPTLQVEISAKTEIKEGEMLFFINERTIFKPFTKLKGKINIKDEIGALDYSCVLEEEGPILIKKFMASRENKGKWVISYDLILEPCGVNPVFDLGWEKGGMTGAGMTFMPQFSEGIYDYTMDWNLSQLPMGAIGAWSYGEGKVERSGDGSVLRATFYAAGEMDRVCFGRFNYYWFENEKMLSTAVEAAKIFKLESEFFLDQNEPYTIFTRHTSAESGKAGGTALLRSYMYLYKESAQLDKHWLKFLFAHEMVHNWITMDDTPFGTCTWYVEGMAEFYSILLPWRTHVASGDEVCNELNKRASEFYENPQIHCTNLEAGRKLMTDAELTKIPYGRGFFYLLHADAMIRRATQGRHCLDDITIKLMKRQREIEKIGNEDWLQEYGNFVGMEQARREYEDFSSGGDVLPVVDCFEGGIGMEEVIGRQRNSGKPCRMWRFYDRGTFSE